MQQKRQIFAIFNFCHLLNILTVDNSHEYLKRNAEDPDIYDCYPQSKVFESCKYKNHKKLLEYG